MEQHNLGTILEGKHQRNAIHIAVAPFVAAEGLLPGIPDDVKYMGLSDPRRSATPPASPAEGATPEIDELIRRAREWPRDCEGALINNLADVVERQQVALRAPTDLSELEGLVRDAGRWRALPAWLEKYQIDYVGLLHDIDAAMKGAKP